MTASEASRDDSEEQALRRLREAVLGWVPAAGDDAISEAGLIAAIEGAFLARANVSFADSDHVPSSAEQLVAAARAQALVRRYVPAGLSLVDELIAERRAASRAE